MTPRMKTKILVSSFLVFAAFPAYAGPTEDAKAAYAKGDYAQAVSILKPLADTGDKDAQYNMGVFYSNGLGVTQSYEQAVYWYTKSAHQNHKIAQTNLGNMYRKGHGVKQSNDEAWRWYKKAADLNHASAHLNLGVMYEAGQGVEQSYEAARSWYVKAKAAGSPKATEYLVTLDKKIATEGNGSKSLPKGFSLYNRPAKQTQSPAPDLLS